MGATSATAVSASAERVGWAVLPATIAVVSRIFSVALLLPNGQAARELPLLVGDPSPLVAWDGQWYLSIAQFGYHAAAIQPFGTQGHHDYAFFPAWPMLIRLVSLGGLLPMNVIAVGLSNALFVLAAITVYRLFADRFDERVALGGVLLLAFNPVAYVFSMAYTESLFVLLAALYFLYQDRPMGPVFAGLSMFTRVSGLAIGAAAAVTFLKGRNGRLWPFLTGLAVVLAFATWWSFIWQLTGTFTGWLDGSPAWTKVAGVASIARELRARPLFELAWGGFVLLMIAGSLLLWRRHTELAVYCLVAIAMSLLEAPASSMPRHSMVAFPAFAAIAWKLGPRLAGLATVVFAIGQIAFVSFAFGPGHRPP